MTKSIRKKLLEKWQEILSIHRWVAYVLPIAVFLIVGGLEPTPSELQVVGSEGENTALTSSTSWFGVPYIAYPWIYSAKILVTLFALRLVWPAYKPLRKSIGWKGLTVGAIGGIVWVSLCSLNWEQEILFPFLKSWKVDGLIGAGTRSAFNPFVELQGHPIGIAAYLLVRGLGLILIVPIIEEHFLRGFVMRYVATDKWWKYPIGQVTIASAIVGTLLPMLMHPGEIFAAAVWFSLISLLAFHTKNLWECIAAHCATNFILGAYVVLYGAWRLV